MKYAAIIDYTPNAATIAAARPAHREYLMGLKAQGKLALAGPLEGDAGGIIVYAAGSAAEAETLIREDPFAKQGVFVSWVIKPWNLIICSRELMPA